MRDAQVFSFKLIDAQLHAVTIGRFGGRSLIEPLRSLCRIDFEGALETLLICVAVDDHGDGRKLAQVLLTNNSSQGPRFDQ